MSTTTQLIIFIVSLGTVYTDTHVCDGSNLVCNSGTVNCLDNEPCLIQCTGAQDCVGTTMNCPVNGDCLVECHSAAGNGGCGSTYIDAVQSLSLTIDNQNVKSGCSSSSIYCPLYGICTLTGSGKDAFLNTNLYASFGFVFSKVSITCKGDCKTAVTMHCMNQYNSSCPFATDGISCSNTPHICDTIFTSINGIWTDDYMINPAPGWIVTDYNNNSINSVYTGTLGTYHGPFYGDADSSTLEVYRLVQYFYCAYTASVYVEYSYAFSCQEDVDWSRLYLNDELYADKHALHNTGSDFFDQNLENTVQSMCPDAWHRKQLNGTLTQIAANTWFKVEIQVALNYEQEVSVINSVSISCIPPDPTTANPTTAGVMIPSVSPTYHPSLIPTTSPTFEPSYAPTLEPITKMPTAQTAVPTTVSPTLSTVGPTKSPSKVPTEPTKSPSNVPTELTKSPTNTPTTNSPSNIPTTKSPSNAPTKPTKAPNQGKGHSYLGIWPTQKLETKSTEDVDFEALIVALCIIGGGFVVTVIVVCTLWLKHEKAYRPFYFKQQQELQEMMQQSVDGPGQEVEQAEAESETSMDRM